MSSENNNNLIQDNQATETTEIDVTAKDWIQAESDKEVKRIKDLGSNVVPLKIINCGVVPNFDNKKARAINRVEVDTQFDLTKIQQIMVSPPTAYPHKDKFNYVNLILVAEQPIPFLIPYLYHTALKVTQPEKEEDGRKYPSKEVVLKNDLKEYLFINRDGIRSRFSIHEYHNV